MRRKDLIKAAGVGAAALAAPPIGRPEKLNELVFVPTQDLGVLDPHRAGPRPRRNHAYVVC